MWFFNFQNLVRSCKHIGGTPCMWLSLQKFWWHTWKIYVCIGYCQSCTFRCYFCESIKELTWPVLLLNCWTLLAKTCPKDDEMLDSRKKNEWKSSFGMSVVEMLQANFISWKYSSFEITKTWIQFCCHYWFWLFLKY